MSAPCRGKIGTNRYIMNTTKALLALLLLVAFTDAARFNERPQRSQVGINCLGSSQCSRVFNTISSGNLIDRFNWTVWYEVDDAVVFYKHRQIVCGKNYDFFVGGICLFLQGNVSEQGVSGAVLKARISDLAYHGCKYCGSVPVSGDNNPRSAGILTANYVHYPVCDGLCFPGEIVEDTPTLTSGTSNSTTSQRDVSTSTKAASASPVRREPDHSISAESQAKATDAAESFGEPSQ